ncbi:unnamed protein product [Thlaspi arvense]|uniref:C2H2-type domain-containing protein n=1 Tax=Thlaspi arvense TaxID=13288 RepID=A0AAU9RR58_THLAR|nr:unnamed protein product [Thlaspi arvense]
MLVGLFKKLAGVFGFGQERQSISVTEISDAEITSRDFVKPSYPEKDSEFRFELPSKGHNLIAGFPGVAESLFEARQAAIAQEKIKSGEAPMLYSCGICGEGYKSPKAHEQHLKSKSHIVKASSLETSNGEEDTKIIKQLPPRRVEKNDPAQLKGSIEA